MKKSARVRKNEDGKKKEQRKRWKEGRRDEWRE